MRESEFGADECLYEVSRGSGRDSASPLPMSEGGETILAEGRNEVVDVSTPRAEAPRVR